MELDIVKVSFLLVVHEILFGIKHLYTVICLLHAAKMESSKIISTECIRIPECSSCGESEKILLYTGWRIAEKHIYNEQTSSNM